MVRKILRTRPRPRVVVQCKRQDSSIPSLMAGSRPWHGQRVRIEDLPAFRARWGLIVAGGDPDLDAPAASWAPKVILVEL